MKEQTMGKKLVSTLMSAALVVAFAPAFVAPQPAQALSTDEQTAINYIQDWYGKKAKITLNGANRILNYFNNELADTDATEYSAEVGSMKNYAEKAIKKINAAQAEVNKLACKDLSASKDFKRSNLTWKVVQKATGVELITTDLTDNDMFFQYKWRIGKSDYITPVKVTKIKKNTKGYFYHGVDSLKGKTTYTFKVRVAKKVYGQTVYSAYSNTATVKTYPKYKLNKKYTVTADTLPVYKKAYKKSAKVKTKKTIVEGKVVTIKKVKIAHGEVWGKAKFNQIYTVTEKTVKDGKTTYKKVKKSAKYTGWVQMKRLKLKK